MPPRGARLAGLLLIGFLAVFGLQNAQAQDLLNFVLQPGDIREGDLIPAGLWTIEICIECNGNGTIGADCYVNAGPAVNETMFITPERYCPADPETQCNYYCLDLEQDTFFYWHFEACIQSRAYVKVYPREVPCSDTGGGDTGGDPGSGGNP